MVLPQDDYESRPEKYIYNLIKIDVSLLLRRATKHTLFTRHESLYVYVTYIINTSKPQSQLHPVFSAASRFL